ncbi:MAG: DedA family protein [Candidatus Nanoarchaeia archaeon]
MIAIISNIVSFILGIIENWGYVGIFVGMTIESSFFPLPSELMLIPAGALISQGKMEFILVFIFAIFGSLFGALINYFLSLSLGRKAIEHFVSKYGKVFFISREELDGIDHYFYKHGDITTFVGRLLPGVRHLISIPAGFSKMNLYKFSLFTLIGAGFWSLILIYAGWLADRNVSWIAQHLTLLTAVIILICALIISSYIIFMKRRKNRKIK